jgi:hypothetical protein
MKKRADLIEQMLLDNGFTITEYKNQGPITYGVIKSLSMDELIQKIDFPTLLKNDYQEAVFEYLPQAQTIQWCVDSCAGLMESHDVTSPEGQKLLMLFIS